MLDKETNLPDDEENRLFVIQRGLVRLA